MSKQIGDIAEANFTYQCLKRGINVSKPVTDNTKYDAIIETPSGLRRIQIKSTKGKVQSKGRWYYQLNCAHGSRVKRVYTNEFIDYFAIYLTDVNEWYIIPVDQISVTKINIYRNDKCNWKTYRERWEYISC